MSSRPKIKDIDHGAARLFRLAQEAGEGRVKVGVLADTEKGGLHVDGGDLIVAEIAAVLEFGTEDGHTPERSFLRATFDRLREELARDGARLLLQCIDGAMTIKRALGLMGAKLAAETKKYITTTPLPGVPPPNAPSTARAKAGPGGDVSSVRSLVDTGRLVNSILHMVVMGPRK